MYFMGFVPLLTTTKSLNHSWVPILAYLGWVNFFKMVAAAPTPLQSYFAKNEKNIEPLLGSYISIPGMD